ncbi:hypothetical protein BM221_004745 [Beauveria bassiana]|uniref:Uncharacterized protein n=1 Tax=Beauveria bassiana TaxID=176275 RepID=A0A2N6NS71_BEABA|nr:hypothetical protein BM221_004745 [Beauveria bassiana]
MFSNILVALVALAPTTSLAQSSESKADTSSGLGIFSAQRLKQVCGHGGCIIDLFVNGNHDYMPGARSFDAHCQLYGSDTDWVECVNQVPYMAPGGLFLKMRSYNQTSRSFEFWFSHEYKEDEKTVNATARMEVEQPFWNISKCREMTVMSKEYI